MRFLGTLLLFGGYVLVYASVANGGKFAAEPWAGVFTDAYPVLTTPTNTLTPTPPSSQSPGTKLIRPRNRLTPNPPNSQ